MADFTIRATRRIDGSTIDVVVEQGRIAALTPTVGSAASGEDIDGRDYVLLPPLVESHVHLDKTLWGEPWRPNSAGPTLKDYIANERRILATVTTPIRKRAGALLEHCIAQGSLHIRAHIDIAPDIGVKHVEAMLELRAAYGDVVGMQFVAFPQTGLLSSPGTAELMEESLKLGVETVGGIDPQGIDGDVLGQLRVVFGLAERYGRGVDIHLHDRGEVGIAQVEQIADFTAASGLRDRVMISHSYCLGMATPARLEFGGAEAGGSRHLPDDLGAGGYRGAAGGGVARDGRQYLLRLRRNSRCLVAHGQWRHAGAGDAAGLSLRLGQGCRTAAGAGCRDVGRREGTRA